MIIIQWHLSVLWALEGKLQMKSNNREITKKDLITALIVVVYMTTIMIIGYSYSKTIAALLFIPIIIVIQREFRKLPQESKRIISNKIKEQEKSPFRKILSLVVYLIVGYITYVLLMSLFK